MDDFSAFSFCCPVCPSRYAVKKELLDHIRRPTDQPHKDLRSQAHRLPHSATLSAMGILCCPHGCGKIYDGGSENVSTALQLHAAKATCIPATATAPARLRERDGPFLNCLEIATKKCPGRGMCVPYSRTVRIFHHSRAITSQEIILVRFMI